MIWEPIEGYPFPPCGTAGHRVLLLDLNEHEVTIASNERAIKDDLQQFISDPRASYVVGYGYKTEYNKKFFTDGEYHFSPTHWMQLPEPPKTETT